MNLALEAIVRNKAIQNLFQTPITIGVWNKEGHYLWITLESKDNEIAVSRWNLSAIKPEMVDFYPPVDCLNLNKDEIFLPEKVIPENYLPIRFIHKSVEHEMNSYKQPMNKKQYEWYHNEMFNPEIHQSYKKAWLWSIFIKQIELNKKYESAIQNYLNEIDTWQLKHRLEDEVEFCKKNFYNAYYQWKMISNKLLIKEASVAGELIFASLFPIK